MTNQNFSKFFNRGISTPIVIFVIVLVAIIAGGIVVWQSGWMQGKLDGRGGIPPKAVPPDWSAVPESCAKNEDCGTDFCQQKEDKCVEIKYICENENCSSITKEFPDSTCEHNKCKEITGDEIIDWKIYKNEEYGYEVKYPPDWEFYKHERLKEVQETTKRIGGVIDSVEFTPKDKVYTVTVAYGVRPIGIFININKPLQQFLTGIQEHKITPVSVNNIPAIEIRGYTDGVTHYFLIEKSDINGFIRIADHIYDIEKTGSISSEEEKGMHEIFNRMLSTFRFLE